MGSLIDRQVLADAVGFATMRMKTGDGADLHYEVTGSGDRIILTHGSWGDGDSWSGVVGVLSEHYQVVTWDRRGHSRSSAGVGPGSYQRDADDLAGIADHLGGPALLVGSSSGASIVLKAVATHPEVALSACVHEPDMLGLIDVARYHAELDRERKENLHVIGLVESSQYEEAARYFIDEIAVGRGTWDLLPEKSRDVFTNNAATIVDEFNDVFDPDPVELTALSVLGGRLLITRGTESPMLLTAVAEELERRVPTARHVTIDGAGHIPYRTHPDLWCHIVIDFVDAV